MGPSVSAAPSPTLMYDDDLSGVDFCAGRHFQLIHFLSASRIKPTQYPHNVIGLSQYMQACGVVNFTADELVRPKYPDRLDADEAFVDPISGPVLLPARWAWPRLVAPVVLLQLARRKTGPVTVRYAYRPPKYNKACGSKAITSDHTAACAVDVAFTDRADMVKALHKVLLPRWRLKEFGLSLGYNRKAGAKLHLGVWAPETERKGEPRLWYYDR